MKKCGLCNEYCPTKAAGLTYYKKGMERPKVDEKICIGCGACEHVCPAEPFKAIYVEGNPVHKTADKPKKGKGKWRGKPREYKSEEFPF